MKRDNAAVAQRARVTSRKGCPFSCGSLSSISEGANHHRMARRVEVRTCAAPMEARTWAERNNAARLPTYRHCWEQGGMSAEASIAEAEPRYSGALQERSCYEARLLKAGDRWCVDPEVSRPSEDQPVPEARNPTLPRSYPLMVQPSVDGQMSQSDGASCRCTQSARRQACCRPRRGIGTCLDHGSPRSEPAAVAYARAHAPE